MSSADFSNACVLVVGGAGFVGSNLVHQILEQEPREIVIVDNLISSDVANIPADPRVRFVFGSITDDKILANLPDVGRNQADAVQIAPMPTDFGLHPYISTVTKVL